jgi:MATE family multidrug resistance protein
MAGGMDTLCGQAFGAQNYQQIGIIGQRAALIQLAMTVPILLAWTKIEGPLVLFGQSAPIVSAAAEYLLWSSPQLLLAAVTIVIEKFQTSQVHLPFFCCLHRVRHA